MRHSKGCFGHASSAQEATTTKNNLRNAAYVAAIRALIAASLPFIRLSLLSIHQEIALAAGAAELSFSTSKVPSMDLLLFRLFSYPYFEKTFFSETFCWTPSCPGLFFFYRCAN